MNPSKKKQNPASGISQKPGSVFPFLFFLFCFFFSFASYSPIGSSAVKTLPSPYTLSARILPP